MDWVGTSVPWQECVSEADANQNGEPVLLMLTGQNWLLSHAWD